MSTPATAVLLTLAVTLTLTAAHAAPALAAPPETPTTYAVETKTATTALFKGVVDESARAFPVEAGTYEFLYKATRTVSVAECESAGAGRTPVPPGMFLGLGPEKFEQEATGLTPNTEYIVCLAAKNGDGTTVGEAVSFVTDPEAPETGEADEITATSVRLEGALKPAGTKLQYEFTYNRGTSCTDGSATPLAEGEGTVATVVDGLTPGAEYTYCLVARGAGGETSGEEKAFRTLAAAPAVSEEFVTSVEALSATLNATIDPDALPTTFHFEYGSSETYGTSVPAPERLAGSGNEDVSLSMLVEGLSPGTTYHYRIVASNGLGEVKGADRTFTTRGGEGAGLIDGRGWELVSPADKHGSALEAITPEGSVIQAAEDGGALAYIAKDPVGLSPAGNRSFAEQQLLATRGPDGWSTQEIATPHEAVAGLKGGELSEYRLFSPDLLTGVVEPSGATLLSPWASERTPYLRQSDDGEYVPLLTACPSAGEPCDPSIQEHADAPPGTRFGSNEEGGKLLQGSGVEFVAATPDLSHVLLTAPQSLAPGFETGGQTAVYEWAAGQVHPISILPGGASAVGENGAAVGQENELVRNAISADGSRVFFQSAGHLFFRDVIRGRSVQLDTPEAGAEGGNDAADYQDASRDGTKVFFTDDTRLTVETTASEDHADLYMCELGASVDERSCAAKDELKDLTIGYAGEAADVQGATIGTGEDGSHVYFVANGILSNGGDPVAGAVHGDCQTPSGALPPAARSCNLYEWHDGVTSLVAVLSNGDFPDWEANGSSHTKLSELTARVSPSGRYLAFMSQRPLTGYDNSDAVSGAADEEVFLYDAASGRTTCASCDPSGARPDGVLEPNTEAEPPLLVDRLGIWSARWVAASIPGWTPATVSAALYQSRYLSNDGRLFFDSPVGLVSGDANGRQDVYEFEPEGVGGCTSSVSSMNAVFVKEVAGSPVGGCVGLISSGTSSDESAFLDASGSGPGGEEGEDVFFLTAAKLAGADVDSALDVYDAHICSVALPCSSAAVTVPPACVTADSCRAAPASQPGIFGAPSSATFGGRGNVPPVVRVRPKSITRAGKLADALKACRRKGNRKKRAACERQARKKYGASKARKVTNKRRARS